MIRRKNKSGYISVKVPDHPNADSGGYIAEHRIVVEEKIGRYLTKEEVVHHLNEIKDDNHINNLMLFKTQKEHTSFHRKLQQFGLTNPIRRQIKNRWNYDL